MKKTIATLALGLSLVLPASAQEIGEVMPRPQGVIIQVSPYPNVTMVYYGDGEKYTHTEAYRVCDGEPEQKPFGIYDAQTGILYLDQDRNGTIDKKMSGKNKDAYQDLPVCPTRIWKKMDLNH